MDSIILLSGGLDSLVSCGLKAKDIKLALTFDYGQKSINKEISASKEICEYYHIKHEIVKLDVLKKITKTSLVSDETIPDVDIQNAGSESTKSVWVPNRNGLFLNIAASYCDSFGYNEIIIGANKEEAQNFPDNTQEFIDRANKLFEYSTMVKPKVVAPLINYNKNDIVKKALDAQIPLNLVQSCYDSTNKHCGKCESCKRLKKALKDNNCEKIIKEIFEDEN
jgi:7-cyano-7-deazaguanine synthase